MKAPGGLKPRGGKPVAFCLLFFLISPFHMGEGEYPLIPTFTGFMLSLGSQSFDFGGKCAETGWLKA